MERKFKLASSVAQLATSAIVGVFFGVVVSIVANLFVDGVLFLSDIRTSFFLLTFSGVEISLGHVVTLATAAVLIYGVRKILKVDRWQGPADTIYEAHRPDNELNVKVGLASTLAAFISASGGASVGQYGPLVHFGAVIGSGLKRFISERLPTDVFIGCGVAAAISAGFGAPIAGVIFAHEAILRHFSLRAIAPIAIASCVAAGMTELLWQGEKLFEIFAFSGDLSALLLGALFFGPFFGAVAVIFMVSVRFVASLVPKYRITPGISLVLAVSLTSLGGIFVPEALGLGGETVKAVMNQDYSFVYLAALLFMKIALTSTSIGFGLFGGVFSPSLLVGAAAGGVALSLAEFMGLGMLSSVGLIVCGMAAVSSSVIGAPIAGVLIVMELTGSYEFALLAMISVVTAVLTSHLAFGQSFFDRQLADRGIDISGGRTVIEMMERPILNVANQDYTSLNKELSCTKAIESMVQRGHTEAYLIDHQNKFLGKTSLMSLLAAKDSMNLLDCIENNPITIKHDASLQQAMEAAAKFVGESIPIIDRNSQALIGVITEADIFQDYLALQNRVVDLEKR